MGDARAVMESVLNRNSTELNVPEETTLKRNSRGRTSLDLRDVTTLARLNYENEGISPLRQLREFNHTIQRTHSRTQPKSVEKTDDNKQSTCTDDNTVSSDSNENLRNKERRKTAVIPNGFNISRGAPVPPVTLSVDSSTMDHLPLEDFPPPDPELLENLDLEKSLKRDIPGVLQIPDKYGHLRTPEEEEKRDDRIIYNMTGPKPVIPVRLSREVTSFKYMPPKRGIVRISKSSENILSDSVEPHESNALTHRSDYHSAEDVLDQKPCSKDRADLEVYQQAVKLKQVEPTEKTAIKSITSKYDSVQRRQLHALSFHDSEKSDMSSIGDVDVFETSLQLEEEHALNAMTESAITVSDMARIELFYQSQGAEVFVCGCAADLLIQGKDGSSEYTHVNVGIPVLVLTTGQKRGQKRELRILLAEKETGFQLWGDNINYLSNYKDESPKVHTLCLSSNHTKTAAFHMHSVSAAAEFLAKFRDISADPNDELWKVGKTKKSKSKPRISLVRKGKKKLNKSDISQPCNFLHVTKVEPIDTCAQGQTDQSFSADFRSRCNTSEW